MKKRYFTPFIMLAAALALSGCSVSGPGSTADTGEITSSREAASQSLPAPSDNSEESEVSWESIDMDHRETGEAAGTIDGTAGETDVVSGEPEAASETEGGSAIEAPSSAFSLDDAQKSFADVHPNAEIAVAKLEGGVYYIEGWEGAILYKMKFAIGSGEIVLDKTISTGRPS